MSRIAHTFARLHDTPAQSKSALDAAVRDDPKNPFAVSALGGWHIEVVRGGGAWMAGMLYGAHESEALDKRFLLWLVLG